MGYTNWHDGRQPGAPFDTCSPNLQMILAYCQQRWSLTNLGCYGVRKIKGSNKDRWSAHAFGAAQDMSYRGGPHRSVIVDEVIPFLEHHADALGIQRIHDYWAKRYWQSGRGWIERPPGSKNDHLHIETTAEAWADARSVEERIGTAGPIPSSKPAPEPRPAPGKPTWKTCRLGDQGDNVRQVQQVLRDRGYKNSTSRKLIVVDGDFGSNTDRRVRQYQKDNRLTVDGIVGPQTAGNMGLC